ncbi:unnamed protein product [Haemonchus placei]|uniref:Uncharacterized protein n=1 Tax=Haemonchus placei TaxID=6290 RepID=A0A3P7TZ43_HAEPC|nr:unnamed protein product [Haemonchus placei]
MKTSIVRILSSGTPFHCNSENQSWTLFIADSVLLKLVSVIIHRFCPQLSLWAYESCSKLHFFAYAAIFASTSQSYLTFSIRAAFGANPPSSFLACPLAIRDRYSFCLSTKACLISSVMGNMLDQLIYDIGDPCTTDEDCQCTSCTCSRDERLCIAP